MSSKTVVPAPAPVAPTPAAPIIMPAAREPMAPPVQPAAPLPKSAAVENPFLRLETFIDEGTELLQQSSVLPFVASTRVADFHAEGNRAFRDSCANSSHADDAQRFAAQFLPQHQVGCPAFPPAVSHVSIGFGDAARRIEKQRQRQIGRGVC